MKFRASTRATLETRIIGTGRHLPLSVFGAKQFSYGVRAKVWGRAQTYRSAFVVSRFGGDVFKRTSKARFPIEQLWGPAVPVRAARRWNAWVWGWDSAISETEATTPGIARQYLERALARPTATAYQLASDINLYARKFDDSLAFARLAVEFAPNDPASHMVMAEALIYGGRPSEAVPWIEAANRLGRDASKRPPPYNAWVMGMAFFGEDQFAEAIALFEDALARNPNDYGPAAPLAAAYWHLAGAASGEAADGHRAKARAALDTYVGGTPDATIAQMRLYWPFRDHDDEERLIAPLREMGLAEGASG